MDFKNDVTLGTNYVLSPPLMNGGGSCKTIEDVEFLARSTAGAIVVGSMTWEPRELNPGNTWSPEHGLNALGMPNGGRPYYESALPEMIQIAHDAGKPLIANIAGFNPEEYGNLAEMAYRCGVDAIELNLGCPNVVTDGGGRKPIACFNLMLTEVILARVVDQTGPDVVIWVKVSPYSDPDQIPATAKVVTRFRNVKVLVTPNTFPKAYAVGKDGRPVIGVGYAGQSGKAMKYIALGQVSQWREALPEAVDVVGLGGISSGQDIADFQAVGASAFQVTTALLTGGTLNPQPLERIATEYIHL